MASSKGARIFGGLVLVACVAVLAGGAWFFFGRAWLERDDVASDDEPDDIGATDGGAATKGHHSGKRRGKGGRGKASGAPRPHVGGYGPPGKSYESAISGNHEQITIGSAGGGPDLTDAQLAGPLRNAAFLDTCGAPESMHVTVRVAIRGGHAVGVTVATAPPDLQIASCIDHSVREIAWPSNPKMDSFVTTY